MVSQPCALLPEELRRFAMNIEAIQNDDQLAANLTMQMPQESHDIGRHDIGVVELPISIEALPLGRKRHRANGRQTIVSSRGILHRGFAARSPGPAVYRLEQEASFVEKHDGSLLLTPLFLMRGQARFRQRSMATSSRSLALRCGFCCVNPSACKILPTWSRWYSIANRWRMTSATRRHVHKLLRKPAAKGPAREELPALAFAQA